MFLFKLLTNEMKTCCISGLVPSATKYGSVGVCVCMRDHVRMCVRESVLVYGRRLIQKFVKTLNKHSNWTDLWLILYIHIVTSLMNKQIKFYESILKGVRMTAHFNQWPLAVRRTPQRHF